MMMLRRIAVPLALLLLLSSPASAATLDEAAAARDTGLYVEPGVSADRAALSAAVARASNAGVRLLVVLLEEDPGTGAATFADAVLDRIEEGTVLVLSPTGVGAASTTFEQATLERALDEGFAAGGGDSGYVDAFVGTLVSDPSATSTTSRDEGGGGGGVGLWIFLIILGGLILVVVWAVRRQSKSAKASAERAISEARAEIKAQLDAAANSILEIADRVKLSASPEDNTYLEKASATFTEASESFESAADLTALEALSDRLDEARWQLDAAEAIAEGRSVPERPKPEERHACFFDPTHPGPFEDAEIRTAAGVRTVKVCGADAGRLRKGADPEPRMIEVAGRSIPAPAAPRSYGGGGIDLGGLFSVVLGGAAGAERSMRWETGRSAGRSVAGRAGRRSPRSGRSGASAAGRSRAGRSRRRRG
jgi:hypothetical protein